MDRYQDEIRRATEKSGLTFSGPRRRLSNGSDHASSSSSSAGTPTGNNNALFFSVSEARTQYLQKINQSNGVHHHQQQQHSKTLPLKAYTKSNSGSSLTGRTNLASRRASASPPTKVIIDKAATAAVAAKINAAGSRTPPVVVNANGYGFIGGGSNNKGRLLQVPLVSASTAGAATTATATAFRPGSYPQLQQQSVSNIPIYENLDNDPVVPLRGHSAPPPPPPYGAARHAGAAVNGNASNLPPALPPKGRPPDMAPPVYENVYEENNGSTASNGKFNILVK